MNVVSIIPARGGSKRVPKKNIKLLNGKPLIAYAIEASVNSKHVNRTIVSTDSEEIATVSKKYGAEVIMRPTELSGDEVQSEEVLLHVLKQVEADVMVFMQCTSPLVKSEHIDSAIEKLNEGFDSVLTCHETYGYYGKLKNDEFVPFRKKRVLRQNMVPWYRDNGAVYVIKRETFLKEKYRFGGRVGMVLMSEEDSFEIDSLFDFWLIEKIIQWRENETK